MIPGRAAPILITADMVAEMKPGAIIVDLAADMGGNCELSTPGEVTEAHGVTILAHYNVPSRLAADSTAMYAKNLLNFLSQYWDQETGSLALDWDDDIIKGAGLTRDGKVMHPYFAPTDAAPVPKPEPEAVPDADTGDAPKTESEQ